MQDRTIIIENIKIKEVDNLKIKNSKQIKNEEIQ